MKENYWLREIETKAPKGTKAKVTDVLPINLMLVLGLHSLIKDALIASRTTDS